MAKCPSTATTAEGLSKAGFDLHAKGDYRRALACHDAAYEKDRHQLFVNLHRAQTEMSLSMNQRAYDSLERAVEKQRGGRGLPDHLATEAYFNLGKLARDLQRPAAAERHYLKAIELNPSAPGAQIMLGVTLRELGRNEEALEYYTRGLELNPGIAAAQVNRALLLQQLGRHEEALQGFEATVGIDPSFAVAYAGMGDGYQGMGRFDEALKALKVVTRLNPQSSAAYYNLGKVYFQLRRLPLAISAHHKALELPLEPNAPHAYIHNDLGNAYSDTSGRASETLHHYSEAARLMPKFAEALSNVGTALKEIGKHEEAARAFERAIDAKPTLCEPYKNLGSVYGEIDGRLPEAVGVLESALRINPEFWPALYSLLDTKQFLTDWKDRATLMRTLKDHLTELHRNKRIGSGPDERMHGGLAPFQTLVMPITVETQLAVTMNRVMKDVAQAEATPLEPPLRWGGGVLPSVPPPRSSRRERHSQWQQRSNDILRTSYHDPSLRIGLISSDFGDHPVGHALLPWVSALSKRKRMDILCFATDAGERPHVGSELRRGIASKCTRFYDVTDLSDADVTHIIDDQRLHVLINLVGHTAGSRHVITEWRPAPVQAMHYGYPATTGLPSMGYMQLDAIAVPPTLHSDFTERLAYFPHCHFVAVHAARYPHAPKTTEHAHPWHAPDRYVVSQEDKSRVTRRDLGLGPIGSRDEAFALCNFNQLYKMDPDSFAVWNNALRRLPNAFLWLSRVSVRKDTSMYAQGHLQLEAASHGVRTERLAFSFKFPTDDYVPFRALADLMVDNPAYNAHTTGGDTLWAGVPSVLTATRHLAGRASASFSHSMGLFEMVAHSWKHYEDHVHELGKRQKRLWALRKRLMKRRRESPFFDLDRLAEGQHRLASAMWGVHAAGRPPMHVIAARPLRL